MYMILNKLKFATLLEIGEYEMVREKSWNFDSWPGKSSFFFFK